MTYLFALAFGLSITTGLYLFSVRKAAARRAKAQRFRLQRRMEETLLLGKDASLSNSPPPLTPSFKQRMYLLQSNLMAPLKRSSETTPTQLSAPHLLVLSFLLGVCVSLITSVLTVSLLVFVASKTCGR